MGNLAVIVNAINDVLVAELLAGGYPALTPDQSGNPGKILVGTASAFEQSSPPRIILEPLGSDFSTGEYYSSSTEIWTEERRRQIATRALASEHMKFACRCWGAADTGNPVDDYDLTRALYHAMRIALHNTMPGSYEIDESGKYTTGSNVIRNGREFVFGLTIMSPILETLQPYDRATRFAPNGVTAVIEDFMTVPATGSTLVQTAHGPIIIPPSGPTETGC